MKRIGLIWLLFGFYKQVAALPLGDPRIVFVPVSIPNSLPQTRGPFDFIGNWIQSSNFFPIEINVPDTFSAIGNTVGGWAGNVGNFAQNIGSGVQGFTQNVGSGIQNFAQGLAQRVPILGAIIRPTQSSPPSAQRFIILLPQQVVDQNNNKGQNMANAKMALNVNSDLFEIFP